MKEVLFLGCLYSSPQKNYFLNNSRRGYEFAANTFQEALIRGFKANSANVTVATIPSLSMFPFGYKKLIVPSCEYYLDGEKMGESFGYVNLPFFNHPFFSIVSFIKRWYISGETKEKIIIAYGMHSKLLKVIKKIKIHYPRLKVCLIIPDLPEFMNANKYYRMLGLKQRNVKKTYELMDYVDYYVPLVDKIIERLPQRKPHVVIEGIWQPNNLILEDKKERTKVILYTGGVNARYGVMDLVKAFQLIPDSDYRLWICGEGDCANNIIEQSRIDNRIAYLGKKTHEEVLALQKKSTLLVNPRHSNEIFTNYSFPSKTMEYLASGTATVMCHLGCIPREYDDYLFYFDDESIVGMKNKMIEICETDKTLLERRGREASAFIKEKKNAKVQVSRILNIL